MESWKTVWRKGLLPLLKRQDLLNLLDGLDKNDWRIIQGSTTMPLPLECVKNWDCEAGCLISYMGMRQGLELVGEVEEFFARMCLQIDQQLGDPAGCRWLVNWWDETPREKAFSMLREEIQENLKTVLE